MMLEQTPSITMSAVTFKEELPHEVVEHVLTWLPVKSLIRFKSVSHRWHSSISDPCFIKSHSKKSPQARNQYERRKLVILNPVRFESLDCIHLLENFFKSRYFSSVDLGFPIDRGGHLASCDGLLCVFVHRFGPSFDLHTWNPAINLHREIPRPRITTKRRDNCFGIGYDHSANDYKVVVVLFDLNQNILPWEVMAFSLSTRTWTTMKGWNREVLELPEASGTCSNGAVHWIVEYEGNGREIIAWDLAAEKFYDVTPPAVASATLSKLDVLDECLAASFCSLNNYDTVELWVMKKYNVQDSWTRLLVLPWVEMPAVRFSLYAPFESVTGEGFLLGHSHSGVNVTLYNIEKGTNTEIIRSLCPATSVVVNVESLIAP